MHLLVSLVAFVVFQQGSRGMPEPARVEIRTFQFAPDTVRLTLGSKVVWTNQDDIEHTVTAGTPTARDAWFSKVLKSKGTSAEWTFDKAGTFTYFCDRHQFMRGTITVTR